MPETQVMQRQLNEELQRMGRWEEGSAAVPIRPFTSAVLPGEMSGAPDGSTVKARRRQLAPLRPSSQQNNNPPPMASFLRNIPSEPVMQREVVNSDGEQRRQGQQA